MSKSKQDADRGEPITEREALREVTRRHFFRQCGVGLGSIALANLMGLDRHALAWANNPGDDQAADPLAPRPTHLPARAKNVIFLFMAGGPSQLELFDFKP